MRRHHLTLDLVRDGRHAVAEDDLTGSPEQDFERLAIVVAGLRAQLPHLSEDPFLTYPKSGAGDVDRRPDELPPSTEVVEQIVSAAGGLDLVGHWARSDVVAGHASSNGLRRWFERTSFDFDWSLHRGPGVAVKRQQAGFAWRPAELEQALSEARAELEVLERPQRALAPGRYRAFLAPSAVAAVLELVSWDGFGLGAHRTRRSPLMALGNGERRLSELVSLREHHAAGIAPRFTRAGFLKPPSVELVERGRLVGLLAGERSGVEFGAPVNAAHEWAEALEMAPGALARVSATSALGTGLYIGNVWYCNFSEHDDCRITGTTRFGCMWAEGGELVAPVPAMRFDDSFYRMFGEQLLDLTDSRERILDTESFPHRAPRTLEVPGALVADLHLTS